jgi:hypothetical protein
MVFRLYALPRFGAVPLDAITQREVRAWVTSLTGRGLAPATCTRRTSWSPRRWPPPSTAGCWRRRPVEAWPRPRPGPAGAGSGSRAGWSTSWRCTCGRRAARPIRCSAHRPVAAAGDRVPQPHLAAGHPGGWAAGAAHPRPTAHGGGAVGRRRGVLRRRSRSGPGIPRPASCSTATATCPRVGRGAPRPAGRAVRARDGTTTEHDCLATRPGSRNRLAHAPWAGVMWGWR